MLLRLSVKIPSTFSAPVAVPEHVVAVHEPLAILTEPPFAGAVDPNWLHRIFVKPADVSLTVQTPDELTVAVPTHCLQPVMTPLEL